VTGTVQRALQKEGSSTNALFNLGVAEYCIGNKDEAASFFRKACEQDPNDEMAREFLKLVSHDGPLAPKTGPALSGTIAFGPFIFSHGSLKRIGLDILLSQSLVRMEGNSSAGWNYRAEPAMYEPNYLSFRMSKLSGQTKIMDLSRSIGCKTAVFGEIGMTQHIITMRLKMVDVESGKLYVNENFRSEGNKKVTKIIQEIEVVLNKSLSKIKGG
jgi:tetratricopeptide (TPR) repeat protein